MTPLFQGMRRQSQGGRWCEGVGTGSHRGPRVGRRGLRRKCNGGRYPLAGGGGVHAVGVRGAGFGVKAAQVLEVGRVFGRGCGVGRACHGLQRPSLGDLRRCGGL